MSSNVPINAVDPTAPTPQNTPLVNAPITTNLSRPTIPETVSEEIDELEDEDPVASLSVDGKRSLMGLLGVQLKQTELQQEFKREVFALEKKYLERTKPLYERRTAIISGSAAPTSEEVAAGQPLAEEFITEPLPEGDATSAPIPEFWLTALRNHIGISELITDRDAGALKNLRDVRLEYLDGEKELGFKLKFYFDPNEYFEDEVLEKTYFYKSEIDYSGDFVYDRAVGTPIRWKEDKDLTKEFEVKKQRNKNTNRVRLVRKAHPVESFFNFFSPPSPPPEEEIDEDDEDAFDARAEIESRLELDYQIGEDIRDRIIPRAVDYFTGKALEFDADDLDSDEYSDDDFEDDESDVEDVPGPGRHRHATKGRGAGKKGEGQEECKQQ
ncbi:NAP-domain-containing protein [Fomitiporia mediterranea MF3/22]|uniref:NAP-domain-containing protein n=1 Tax=Fomitiporia mediterranea (strain MF3/22) TaxID=694068 RepID=UPI00044098D1|nr:NAP-domain-containing protein [Fomitiporia mediterranea MF3/22]EJC99087.1 NAP-domain-containing protein [Fomitiporia mediterranea MF3/22]